MIVGGNRNVHARATQDEGQAAELTWKILMNQQYAHQLMTWTHSPWPLFSDDLDCAQSWVRGQLNRFPMTSKTGHTALDIGLRDEVERHLNSQPKEDRMNNASTINSDSAWLAWTAYGTLTKNCSPTVTMRLPAALLRTPPETKHP